MKEYTKPIIKDIKIEITDCIATSLGKNEPGDKLIPDFWEK